jgi:hydroxyquinol 1,2-dioxygenase
MQELTPETITDAVLEQMASTPDPRLKEIMASAVKHLHAFARDVNLTPAEWIQGIAFMTAVGKICTSARQEFILLSDTLGLSALVNGLHDSTAMEEGTHTSLLGPFYREAAPKLAAGSQIAKTVRPGSECVLYGRVTDVNGKPLADATVSIWQTGADGLYDIQESAASIDYRGVFTTDADGIYVVRTVKPIGYSIPMDGPVGDMVRAQRRHGMRPAHIHFLVGAPGYRELVTALYLRDDPHIADDVVFGSSGDLAIDIKTNDTRARLRDCRASAST